MSAFDCMLPKTFVSSAKRNPSNVMLSRISFIKMMNRIRPRTLVLGIPLIAGSVFDDIPCTLTAWVLPERIKKVTRDSISF